MQRVSDIHIQVRQAYTKIRMRQHGELRVYAEWSAYVYERAHRSGVSHTQRQLLPILAIER